MFERQKRRIVHFKKKERKTTLEAGRIPFGYKDRLNWWKMKINFSLGRNTSD
jgi:hypothetical protein